MLSRFASELQICKLVSVSDFIDEAPGANKILKRMNKQSKKGCETEKLL